MPHADWIAGGLGVVITVLEGLLHLNQYQQNWIAYRSTCESLKTRKVRLHREGDRRTPASPTPAPCSPRRVESLVSQEHAKWASAQQETTKTDNAAA